MRSSNQTSQVSSQERDQALDAIILQNHPLFSSLKRRLNGRYRVFFTNRIELDQWLKGARSAKPVDESEWDDPHYFEYILKMSDQAYLLKVDVTLFDEFGNLKPMLPGDWNEKMLTFAPMPKSSGDLEDEIPF